MTRTLDRSAADASFDRYARLVRQAVGSPIGLVTVVEPTRQVFPGADGLPPELDAARETPLSHSFCQFVVADRAPLIVTDAREHATVRGNPAIEEYGVVAYAGWPLIDGRGDVVGSVCAIHDEPHDWTEQELRNLADLAAACSAEHVQRDLAAGLTTVVDELERSNTQLAEFAGQVSHDLRNPLAALVGSLEMLRDNRGIDDAVVPRAADGRYVPRGEDDEEAFLLLRALRSAGRMADLLAAVLDFATVGGRLQPVEVDAAELVQTTLEDLDLRGRARLIDVGPLSPVVADPVQLKLIVQNLVGNALKHAPGARIEILADTDGSTWTLDVVDHGPGVAPADRDRVFGSFVRLDRRTPGSGLGLATCRRAVEAHGGDIALAETPGGGATVRVTLPQGAARRDRAGNPGPAR